MLFGVLALKINNHKPDYNNIMLGIQQLSLRLGAIPFRIRRVTYPKAVIVIK